MEFLIVLFMAFMVFAMFAIDYQFCKIREALNDMKILMELKNKYIGKDTNVTTKESEKDNG
jgi:hypothetical protein